MPEATCVRWYAVHRRLYAWVLRWAAHRHAGWALAGLAAAEASVFPVPPDVLLVAMTLARPRAWARWAGLTTLASVAGGLAGYGMGFGLWQLVGAWFFEHLGPLGFTPENFAAVQRAYGRYAFWAVLTAGFTPIPYKVFTVAAGVFEVSLATFTAASLLGRAGRFFLVAGLVRWVGPPVQPFVERHLGWLSLVFLLLLLGGFWVLRGG